MSKEAAQGPGARIININPHFPHRMSRSSPRFPQRSDGRKDGTHSAQQASTIGDYPGVTRCLSNLYPLTTRKSGVTLRRRTHLSTHLREKEGSLRLIPRVNLLSEPRASPPRRRTVQRSTLACQGTVVGVPRVHIGWYIPGWCIYPG